MHSVLYTLIMNTVPEILKHDENIGLIDIKEYIVMVNKEDKTRFLLLFCRFKVGMSGPISM